MKVEEFMKAIGKMISGMAKAMKNILTRIPMKAPSNRAELMGKEPTPGNQVILIMDNGRWE